MNYPAWVTNATTLRAQSDEILIRLAKISYTIGSCQKLRVLFNAGFAWMRGEDLTPHEEHLLAEAFPGQWPNPPTEEQVRTWVTNWWKSRQHDAQDTRGLHQIMVAAANLDWIDLEGMI